MDSEAFLCCHTFFPPRFVFDVAPPGPFSGYLLMVIIIRERVDELLVQLRSAAVSCYVGQPLGRPPPLRMPPATTRAAP